MRVAYIGDIHGSLPELKKLYGMLEHYSLDRIEHCGDLVDRGPDSAGVIQFCREHNIQGVLGNHDGVILQYCEGGKLFGKIPKNPDKARTLGQITKDPLDVQYLKALPYYKINKEGERSLLQVHAGVHPFIPLEEQQILCCTASLIHPAEKKTRWAVVDKKGIPEAVHRANGWFRWYELYAWPHDVVVGHHVFHQDENLGRAWRYKGLEGQAIYGVDTGGWFTKSLTAVIWPDEIFVSTKFGEYR